MLPHSKNTGCSCSVVKNGKAVPHHHTCGTSWQEVPREAENPFSNDHAATLKHSRQDASRASSPALRVSISDSEYARKANVAIPLLSTGALAEAHASTGPTPVICMLQAWIQSICTDNSKERKLWTTIMFNNPPMPSVLDSGGGGIRAPELLDSDSHA